MTGEKSEIIPYFYGKNIFLTGATGFVGKLLIDQLLRKCEPNKLYLLVRTKKGVEPKQRFEQLFQDLVYDRLRNEKPNFIEKVELINGDLSEDNLGLNEESATRIIENVNIVIHGGATVRFDESIKVATNINVKGTISVIQLCHKIKNLNVFLYISTLYSNCSYREIKEEFHDSPIDPVKLVKIVENSKDEELEILLNKILGKWPNTYTFTKAVAENAMKTLAKGLPAAVFRPAMILGAVKEPLPGWVDNTYGPIGVVLAIAFGVLRVLKADLYQTAEMVPGDMVASCILAIVHKSSQNKSSSDITVYNYPTHKDNSLTWEKLRAIGIEEGSKVPLTNSVWFPAIFLITNPLQLMILNFGLHFLPALFADVVLFSLNKNVRALKFYRKGRKFVKMLEYFCLQKWTFFYDNTTDVWKSLNEHDKKLFNFDMSSVDWVKAMAILARGGRVYVAKDPLDTVPQAVKKYKRQKIIHKTIVITFYGFVTWFLGNFLLKLFY